MTQEPFSFANLSNATYIESLYRAYLKDPQSVDRSWQHFFSGIDFSSKTPRDEKEKGVGGDLSSYLLIQAYRIYGHKAAHINPLTAEGPSEVEELKLAHFGLSLDDFEREFATHGFLPKPKAPLKEIIEALKKTYCGSVGFEYVGFHSLELEKYIQSQIEPHFSDNLSAEEKIFILKLLNRSETFESFIHMKYPGQKRFSVEGGETIIPILWKILEVSSSLGGKEGFVGMAHRGRLNVLANILGKSYSSMFYEFESHYIPASVEGSGDVKYHKGYEAKIPFSKGDFTLTLAANPSHLEAVNPVVLGSARARQEEVYKGREHEVVPILIHGDAALAGQGVIYESLQLSAVEGYSNFGTIHIVINNQIGFTALPKESRSTLYCTDIAKGFNAPIFHLNAEDPEHCLAACRLATEIRFKFGIDVFLDLNCYRKYGHNETDEPAFTQPRDYQIIREKKNIRDLFAEQLVKEGVIDQKGVEELQAEFKEHLEAALKETKAISPEKSESTPSSKIEMFEKVETAQSKERLRSLADCFCRIPETVVVHPKLKRHFDQRKEMVNQEEGKRAIDWGMGEYLAYASLLTEGIHIRISGQDSERGTFSHRNAVIVDQTNQEKYYPLQHLSEEQASFDIYNSPLSEYAVMGFEFGYSLIYEKALVIWEAQYGDFANGAQIIIDQFVTSAEQKWGQNSSLTLFLPHGYEGQGPEHSSARIERYLQLAGNESVTICLCTHPAQVFHLLRRQALRSFKRPLILFTPKALLRYAPSLSSLEEFTSGTFNEILDDPRAITDPKRLIFCTGKIYFDLSEECEKRKRTDIALIRVEQLYPLPVSDIKKILDKYQSITEAMWVQEEHLNMGAWDYMRPELEGLLGGKPLKVAARERCASPAAGSSALHKKQHEKLMKDVFYEG